jgi:hypothetical protein
MKKSYLVVLLLILVGLLGAGVIRAKTTDSTLKHLKDEKVYG